MRRTRLSALATVVLVLSIVTVLAGCDIRVRRGGDRSPDRTPNVDVRTPLGNLTVRDDVDAARVGLPVYAGARPINERGDRNADVQIDTPFFALDVAASKFESGDAPEDILAFYRTELAKFGAVTECRGDVDFRGRRDDRVVCNERWRRSETQLVVGSRHHHRIVSVKPRGNGAEFALVHIDTHVPDFN